MKESHLCLVPNRITPSTPPIMENLPPIVAKQNSSPIFAKETLTSPTFGK